MFEGIVLTEQKDDMGSYLVSEFESDDIVYVVMFDGVVPQDEEGFDATGYHEGFTVDQGLVQWRALK